MRSSDIEDCGNFLIFGYIRAKSYITPWGRIYFPGSKTGKRCSDAIVELIRRKAGLD
jgi:hypothetical protein